MRQQQQRQLTGDESAQQWLGAAAPQGIKGASSSSSASCTRPNSNGTEQYGALFKIKLRHLDHRQKIIKLDFIVTNISTKVEESYRISAILGPIQEFSYYKKIIKKD
ncbi:hypothetical protein TSAR_007739 [Trichomalopsis sarcophagae]|uniref:Uncharacterized protein n=1 Tax=Trichomalopsis sarcophagae TaxID=543379 RepID=A0A232EJL9_9HYME|nr:hypothetical protein TSAR_007739 [Trichomalopsis sarcophagae]